MRIEYVDDYVPAYAFGEITQVSQTPNVWDITYDESIWHYLFENDSNIIRVLGANTENVTSMEGLFLGCSQLLEVPLFNTSNAERTDYMFRECQSLRIVPLYDTSKVENMQGMFQYCTSLEEIPLFNTSSVENISWCFDGCENVTGGALALYNQVSQNEDVEGSWCFQNCGISTETGRLELERIPRSWGGLGEG
jgi:surface protein